MQTKREKELVTQIGKQYGNLIDLKKTPGILIEILREFGPGIRERLGDNGTGGGPGVSSIAIAGPGSGGVTTEDLMRVILDLRQEVIKVRDRLAKK
jgi:hypothetical protein